jgi:hypothetical protein
VSGSKFAGSGTSIDWKNFENHAGKVEKKNWWVGMESLKNAWEDLKTTGRRRTSLKIKVV